MKDLLLHVSSKSSMCSLVAKFINKLIEESDILAQEAYHLLLHLDLTSSSCLVAGLNVRPLKQLCCDLPNLKKGLAFPLDTYVEQYYQYFEEWEDQTLFEMHTLFNWSLLDGFKLCT